MKKMLTNLCTALIFVFSFSGCASINAESGASSLNILREALTSPISALESRAEQNEAKAQYALAIVYQYGLHHYTPDIAKASGLKTKALASRGYTPITQYIAGLNGKPGRTAIINLPRYDVSRYEAQMSDSCAEALYQGYDNEAAFKSCQGAQSYALLKPLWAAAKEN